MTAPIFVTATGTDAGKTHILCALLRAACARGLTPTVLKPVHSGFNPENMDASDSARLLRALGRDVTAEAIDAITPFRFTAPLSPDMAAAREGVSLTHADIVAACTRAMRDATGPVFIEGAGGVMSPIAQDGLNLDLICALGARPILVCGAYLGAISHTLTAVSAMRAAGAAPALVLLNAHPPGPTLPEEVVQSLARFSCSAAIWREAEADAALDALSR
jgi:dethiobiotin synthetase